MSGSKYFDRIAVIVITLTLALTILFMNGAALGVETATHTMGYENRLFDNTRVHTVDIAMNDWEDMINNAANEEYYVANVVIDGETYKNVGIRTKGNTSLSTVTTLGSERYSLKIEFDHYDKTESYHGLDKLSLNNLIQDSTMMKDYLTYTMMNEFGVASSLCSYVYITVNGEEWGLYLAVEGVEESFLERNYGSDYGELYKPDSMSFGGGRGNGKNFDIGDFDFGIDDTEGGTSVESIPSGNLVPPSMPSGEMMDMPPSGGGEAPDGFAHSDIFEVLEPSAMPSGNGKKGEDSFGGGSGMGSSDVKLQYIDDDLSSYSDIWDNAKTDITEADQNRLIESLKKLSGNEDVASVVDIEQVMRYFVVHNYVCNGDSYTGSMVHNYYLYEKDGKLSMLPWDYNLAFGTFRGGDANSTINTPIDSPVENGSGEDRPMWSWIVSNEEYTEMYHQYFAEFLSMDIAGIIEKAYTLIKDYVEKDPTAFYDYEEFERGVETLRQFCTLRSESISVQLEKGETVNDMNYVDASTLMLSDIGSMGGGTMPSVPDDMGSVEDAVPGSKENPSRVEENIPGDFSGEMQKENGTPDLPENFDSMNLPDDFEGNFPDQFTENGGGDTPPDK